MNSDDFYDALVQFFQEDYELAKKAGYNLEVFVSSDGLDVEVDLDTSLDNMPQIYVKPLRTGKCWIFRVRVEFPKLDLDEVDGGMASILSDWKAAAVLADDINSIKFYPEDFI